MDVCDIKACFYSWTEHRPPFCTYIGMVTLAITLDRNSPPSDWTKETLPLIQILSRNRGEISNRFANYRSDFLSIQLNRTHQLVMWHTTIAVLQIESR